jgi:hypothetical protein
MRINFKKRKIQIPNERIFTRSRIIKKNTVNNPEKKNK